MTDVSPRLRVSGYCGTDIFGSVTRTLVDSLCVRVFTDTDLAVRPRHRDERSSAGARTANRQHRGKPRHVTGTLRASRCFPQIIIIIIIIIHFIHS